MSADDLVHFTGPWSSDEQALVQAAIEHVEAMLPDTTPARTLGEPWVCTCQHVRTGRRFTAHRAGFPSPLSAASVPSLVRLLLAKSP